MRWRAGFAYLILKITTEDYLESKFIGLEFSMFAHLDGDNAKYLFMSFPSELLLSAFPSSKF